MQLRTNSPRFCAAAILAAALSTSLAHAQATSCTAPPANCGPGTVASTVVDADQFGPSTSQWHSEPNPAAPNAPRLKVDKFVPAAGQTLIQADITFSAVAGGVLRIENRDPLNSCIDVISLNIDLGAAPVVPIPGIATVALNLMFSKNENLSAYDGVTDFGGSSGKIVNVDPVMDSECFRITDAPTLALLTDTIPADAITEQVEWMHQAIDTSQSIGCAPQTFESDPLATLTITVTYKLCSVQLSDCDNDGISDQDELLAGTQHDFYSADGKNFCTPNGIPDECEQFPDCDDDNIPDACDKDITTCDCREINRRQCGSLLLYPELDNREGVITLVSVTYACCDEASDNATVEFRFIRRENCLKDDRTFTLTPCDTLTFLTRAVDPNPIQGYMYAYAKLPVLGGPGSPNSTGEPIVFNHLIGQEMILDGIRTLSYSMNAVSFRGLGEEGALNDDDQDGIRDLNGPGGALPEYEEAPDQILIPRFLGQDAADDGKKQGGDVFHSELILINLSGGARFTAIVSFLIFNDNEDPTSGEYEFRCWDKPLLRDFSAATLQSALENTIDDPDEIVGANYRNAGWIRLDGLVANSDGPEVIDDPAIYAVLIERAGTYAAADLPWEECNQNNGDLLPLGNFGDGPNPVNNDNQ
jgi:hypothetical protein